jgi:hypothetical protein
LLVGIGNQGIRLLSPILVAEEGDLKHIRNKNRNQNSHHQDQDKKIYFLVWKKKSLTRILERK